MDFDLRIKASVLLLVTLTANWWACAKQNTLPGILSSVACPAPDGSPLRAVCACRDQHVSSMRNVYNLCNITALAAFADCVHNDVNANETSTSFLRLVFDKDVFLDTIEHACGTLRTILFSCQAAKVDCDQTFVNSIHSIDSKTLNEQTACRITDDLGLCHWKALQTCRGNYRHIWARIAQAFQNKACTLYHDATVPDHKFCRKLSQTYPVEPGSDPFETCIQEVVITRNCIELEHRTSLSPSMRYQNIEFDPNRFTRYQHEHCHVKTLERSDACDHAVGRCNTAYTDTFKDHITRLDSINVTEVCSGYTALLTCIRDATEKCPVTRRLHTVLWCSYMPRSCPCEALPVPGAASAADFSHLRIAVLKTFVIACVHFVVGKR